MIEINEVPHWVLFIISWVSVNTIMLPYYIRIIKDGLSLDDAMSGKGEIVIYKRKSRPLYSERRRLSKRLED